MARYACWVTVTEEVDLLTSRFDLTGEVVGPGPLSDERATEIFVREWAWSNGKSFRDYTVTAFSVLESPDN